MAAQLMGEVRLRRVVSLWVVLADEGRTYFPTFSRMYSRISPFRVLYW